MNKLISCGPLKLERLFIWTRGHSNRDAQRCQLLENDEQGGVIVVQLVKGKSQSLGLTISGGTDKASPPYVANVRSGGLADESDYFSVGDLILEINEKDVTRLKHSEIIKFIQEAGKRLCFKMQYKKLPGEAIVKSTTLNLCKEHNEMKFTLRGGRSRDGLINRPITIADIKHDSEIARCGEVFEGDIVLALNNKSLENLHNSEIKSIVKDVRNDYTLKIQFNVDKKGESEQKGSDRTSVMVEISRPHESVHPGLRLDVSLESEQFGSIVIVSEVTESGLASRSGAISVGDTVLGINGVSMDGMSVDQARKIMESSGKTIQLQIMPFEQPTSAQPTQGSMNDFLQFLAKERTPENEQKTRTPSLSLNRPTLRQYPSKTSLSSLKRLNSTERSMPSAKPQESQSSFQNYRSIKRGMTMNSRFGTLDDTRSLMSNCSTLSQCNIGNMISRTEVTSLVLIAEDGDFGIEIQDGMNGFDMNCIIVRSLISGKAADRSGVLQVGDRVLSINGIRTEFMSVEEFYRAVYESGTSLRMEIEFDVTDSIVPSSGTFTVKLPRSENTGIILAETNSDDREKYLRVVDIKKASVAYRMGILAPGDQIVHINGVPTSGLSLYEANEMIRKYYDVIKITVKKDEEIQGNSFGVEFNRRGEQLGITISGSEEPFDPIYITSIIEGSIAGRSDAVRIGDRLLAINEITLRGKPLWKAFELLRTAGDTVKLLIKRDLSSMSVKQTVERELASDSCEMTPLSKDVQQWVLNTSNVEDNIEKDRCPPSQGSASTESYCDISDSLSSVSELNVSSKKRVAKRPNLPAWQQECLKNYDGFSASDNKCEEFTKSERVTRFNDLPISSPQIDRRCASEIQLQNSLRSIDAVDNVVDPFRWRRALASDLKQHPRFEDQTSFDYEPRRVNEAGSPDGFINEDVRFSPPIFNTSEFRLTSALASLPVCKKLADEEYDRDANSCMEKESVKDIETLEKLRTRNSRKELGSSDKSRKMNRSLDLPKAKVRAQGSGGGLLNAVAYFENLEKAAQPERSQFGQISRKNFKTRGGNVHDSFESKSALSFSPFQLDISSKSDIYLRELERRTEAQYNDIKEKLRKSSLESIEMKKLDFSDEIARVRTPQTVEELPDSESGHCEGIRTHGNNVGREERYSDSPVDEKLKAHSKPDKSKADRKPGGKGSVKRTTTHRIVITKKEYDEDFGFSISERIDGRGIYIKSIQASIGGSGKLKKYDRLLQVNGINTRELACDDVIPLLQRAGRRLQLVVERVQRDGCP